MKLNALAGFVVMFVLPMMPVAAWATEQSAASTSLLQAGERVTERLESLILQLPLIGVAIAIILGFYLLARWVGHWEQPFSRMRANRFIQNMVRQITQLVIVGIGILTALEILDATALVGAVLG
ncbi:MAG: hypothetical protein R3352_11175, partial [Salinisphaeraceae bacterium]|nr:hypothetical protein [Salinisphaeraceae bacterium]